jgi:hypothetical protein
MGMFFLLEKLSKIRYCQLRIVGRIKGSMIMSTLEKVFSIIFAGISLFFMGMMIVGGFTNNINVLLLGGLGAILFILYAMILVVQSNRN